MTKQDLLRLYDLRREIDENRYRLIHSSEANPANSELRDAIRIRLIRLAREKKLLIDWLDSLDDPFYRRVLMFKYFDGLTWQQVAQRVGGGNSSESLRKVCDRLLKKIN